MKKSLAVVLSVVLLFLSVSFIFPKNVVYAATQEELEAEIDRLNGEISSNKKKLDSLSKEKQKNKEYLNTLEKQISSTEKKADALETQIQSIDKEISKYDGELKSLKSEIMVIEDEIKLTSEEIKNTQDKIEATKDDLSQKLRTAYINGKQSTIKILMGSTSLASFLTRLEFMKRTSEDEKRVFDEFKEQASKLKKAKSTLEEDKTKLSDKKSSVEATKAKSVAKKQELSKAKADYNKTVSSLEKDYSEVEKYIDGLDKSSKEYNDYLKKLESEKKAADAEIDEIIRKAAMTTTSAETTLYASNNDTTSGSSYNSNDSWAWPLGGASCYISSGYGNRSASISGWSFHGGIDIAGGGEGFAGKPVYASRAGRVIAAVKTVPGPKGGRGYGNYVVIDHGDGFATLYGHCWNINVTTGQYVAKGQQISTVGSTGNSTGYHLHFEVRYNNVKQNPLKYVKH